MSGDQINKKQQSQGLNGRAVYTDWLYEEARRPKGEAPILVKLFPRLNSGKFSPFPLQFYRVFAYFLMAYHSSSTRRVGTDDMVQLYVKKISSRKLHSVTKEPI